MKIKRTIDGVSIEMTGAEAQNFLEELLDVPGGTKLPKIKQVCRKLGLWSKFEGERVAELRRGVLYNQRKKEEA